MSLFKKDRSIFSVEDQYINTGTLKPDTHLFDKDIEDLLSDVSFISPDIIIPSFQGMKTFSVARSTPDQIKAIRHCLKDNPNKNIFIPLNYGNRHWFYLLRENGNWIVHDSLPLENNKMSEGQKDRINQSKQFLKELTGSERLSFKTSAQQDNAFDCGSRVINAYRKLVNKHYLEKNHQEILLETLEKQRPQISKNALNSIKEDLSPTYTDAYPDKKSYNTTCSSNNYAQYIKDYIGALKKKNLKTDNKIAIEDMDNAQADAGESDEAFAIRLQEAEFRKSKITI
jgi:hypothetical protein